MPSVNIIEQLETALASKDITRRAEVLRRVTDLFVLGSGTFSEDQVDLFDDVMSRLVDSVEVAACVQFGDRMARLPDAPLRVIRSLARSDVVEVAGPVLTHCERIGDVTLLEAAQTKSQEHLLAISHRRILPEAITDVLLDRGNHRVVASTAQNDGARFSDSGVAALVEKAADDGALALCVWSRQDIPRQNLVQLFVDASEHLKSQLVAADPRRAEAIKAVVAEAAIQIQTRARAESRDFALALAQVEALRASGKLDKGHLRAFADEPSFDRTAAALSLMCDLPVGLVERALVQTETRQILVLAKAIDLAWETTRSLLLVHAGVNGSSRQLLDQCELSYARLQQKSAQTALQFYRMREKAVGRRA
jgi:uncharacterized protein (DUF2336 family)